MIKGAQDMLAGSATELAGFEIVDDYHFNITLEYPFAPFVKNIGTSYADIFPEDACTAAGENWGLGTDLIGTGPYKIAENDDTTPVSYTHLDVYKRQGQGISEYFVDFAPHRSGTVLEYMGECFIFPVNVGKKVFCSLWEV